MLVLKQHGTLLTHSYQKTCQQHRTRTRAHVLSDSARVLWWWPWVGRNAKFARDKTELDSFR